jgi:prolyl-tRNA synthetase
LVRGVEVGNTFKLGTKYTSALGATYLSEQGQLADIVMGSYGIGVDRLIACIAEGCHDEHGLVWPSSVAPYQVYLVGLDLEQDSVVTVAERVYRALSNAGIEVLYDDRDERAGVKFKDADLLGMPLRITVSRRTLARDAVELKARRGSDVHDAPVSAAVDAIASELASLADRVT